MKRFYFACCIVLGCCHILMGQALDSLDQPLKKSHPGLSDPTPYFVALVVSDIDRSIRWYEEKWGFHLLNRLERADLGFKQANLKRGAALLELIERKDGLSSEMALAPHPDMRALQGIFKFGFAVQDFDAWVAHLQESGAAFHGRVVQDPHSEKRMLIIKDPDGNRIQLFEQ